MPRLLLAFFPFLHLVFLTGISSKGISTFFLLEYGFQNFFILIHTVRNTVYIMIRYMFSHMHMQECTYTSILTYAHTKLKQSFIALPCYMQHTLLYAIHPTISVLSLSIFSYQHTHYQLN